MCFVRVGLVLALGATVPNSSFSLGFDFRSFFVGIVARGRQKQTVYKVNNILFATQAAGNNSTHAIFSLQKRWVCVKGRIIYNKNKNQTK